MQDTYTIDNKIRNAKLAESKITNLKAKKESDEKYLGTPTKASIQNVITKDLEENVVIRFIVELPNEKKGHIDFTEYMVNEGELDIFLENIGCTTNDFSNGFYEKIPVTYTSLHGWKAFYAQNKSTLKTHLGNSLLKELEPESAHIRPNKKLKLMYHSLFYLTAILFTYLIGLSVEGFTFGIMFGIIVWIVIWYLDAMWAGLNSPRELNVKT